MQYYYYFHSYCIASFWKAPPDYKSWRKTFFHQLKWVLDFCGQSHPLKSLCIFMPMKTQAIIALQIWMHFFQLLHMLNIQASDLNILQPPPPLIPFPTRSFLHLDYFVIITPCKFEAFCGSLNFPEVKFGCNISHHHLFFALWKHFLHFFPFLIKKKGSCGSWSHVSLTAKWFLFTSPATCHSNTETWIAQKPTKEHTHTFTEVLDWCNALSN